MIKFKRVHIQHLLGIDDCEYEPGESLTVFEGPNEAGKTSNIRALLSLVGDRKGLRQPSISAGHDTGSLFIETDDGETWHKIFTRGGKPRLVIKDAKGKRIPGPPQEYVDSLIRAVSTNPIRFADEATPKKERLAMLLSVMPVGVTAQELAAAAGHQVDVLTLEEWLRDADNPLSAVDRARRQLFDRRHGVNQQVTSKAAHVKELEGTLPEDLDESVVEELAKVKQDAEMMGEEREIRRTAVLEQRQKEITLVDARMLAETRRAGEDKAAIEAQSEKDLKHIEEDLSALSSDLTSREATLEERARQHHQAAQTRTHIEASAAALGEAEAQSAELTLCLGSIDELKREKLAGMPIEGLEIRGDDIFIDLPDRGPVVFEDLNTAKRVEIGVLISTMGGGPGPVCIDGIERLDAAHTRALEQLIDDSGLQFFATRLMPTGKLKIRTRSRSRGGKKR